jgi:hypothetical protein
VTSRRHGDDLRWRRPADLRDGVDGLRQGGFGALQNFRVTPLWQRMTASVDVRAMTERPRSSQISPV